MGLKLTKILPSGVSVEYWRIVDTEEINKDENKVMLTLGGYISYEGRQNGDMPVTSVGIVLEGEDYPFSTEIENLGEEFWNDIIYYEDILKKLEYLKIKGLKDWLLATDAIENEIS